MLIRIGVCVTVLGVLLFFYLERQNELTQLKIQLPQLEKKIATLREESCRLRYEVDQFENPMHLIELAHRPEFGHLKYPLLKEILTVPDAIASNE
jgi:hypothetical protein